MKLFGMLILVSLFQFPLGNGGAQDKVIVAMLRSVVEGFINAAYEQYQK